MRNVRPGEKKHGKTTVLVLNDRDLNSAFGGQASFIKNLDPWLREEFTLKYVTLPSFWLQQRLFPVRLVYLLRVILFLIRYKNNFDLVISHTPEASYAVSYFKLPFIHIFHGNANPVMMSTFWYGKYFKSLFSHFETRIIKKAYRLFTVGEARPEADKLYNPVDLKIPKKNRSERRDFTFAGRLEAVKNVDRIIINYSKLPITIRDNNKLNIIGTGSKEKFLKRLVSNLELRDTVIFHSLIDNDTTVSLIGSSMILLLASSSEGFPMVIAESLTCGTPVLTTDVGDIRSVIKNGYNGFLLSPDASSDEFSGKINLILSDFATFSANAEHSSSVFNAQVIAKSLISACDQIILT